MRTNKPQVDQNGCVELKKHVNAIHCTNNLSLIQRKLFNGLLLNAYPDLPYKKKFEIPVRHLSSLIGYNSNNTAKLKKALLGLITIAIEWNVIDTSTGSEDNWKASSILASAELKGGCCYYEYSDVMKELLYQPEIYGKIDISLVARFKSSYGLALYENCIRYKGLPQTPWFTMDVYRKIMGVVGNKYPVFKDFNKRVIKVAIDELNAIGPIHVVPEFERQNQKVTRIRFKLSKPTAVSSSLNIDDTPEKELQSLLAETFCLSKSAIADVMASYELSYIKDKVALILSSDSYKSGKIRAIAGYLLDALRKDYKPAKSSQAAVNDAREQQQQAEQAKQEYETQLERSYKIYVENIINSYVETLSESGHTQLLKDFEEYLLTRSEHIRKWYKELGFTHPAIRGEMCIYIRNYRAEELGYILPFEDFISSVQENLVEEAG